MSDSITVGLLSPFQTDFDPRFESDFFNHFLNWQVFDSPMRPSSDGRSAVPCLLDGPLRQLEGRDSCWWARVCPGVRFSDGTELTPQHLVDSLRFSPAVREEIDVRLQDDKIVFQSRRPRGGIEWLLTHHAAVVVLERDGSYLGTGPYYNPTRNGVTNRLDTNPYSQQKPSISTLELATYPATGGSKQALIEAINRGDVDLTLGLGRDDVRLLRGVHHRMGQGRSTCYLYLNTQRPFLDDPAVRRALALGIDRSQLAEVSYERPQAFAATGVLPSSIGVMPDGIRTDVEAAREALGSSIPDRPLRLIVIPVSRQYLPDPRATADALVDQLSDLGLSMKVDFPQDVRQYMDWIAEGDYDMVMAGWIADTPDPPAYLEAILSSQAVPGGDRSALLYSNKARYSSDEMDAALERFREDPGFKQLMEISHLIDRDRPLIPLLYGAEIAVSSWKIRTRPNAYFCRAFIAEMKL
ncbi:MAG: ABC transporter substrate-binding protein [Thermoanaerobaculia bacterium]|nr:ABC transporter substrate-binding protein [Thermoanaerobaculia bacterium]